MANAEDALYELLKSADVVETNEDASIAGVNTLRQDEAPVRDMTSADDVGLSGDAVRSAVEDGRRKLLEDAFPNIGKTDAADNALMREAFDHVASGDFSAHSVHLTGATKVAQVPTLQTRVRELLGRE